MVGNLNFLRHANLLCQVPNPPKITMDNWKCENCAIKEGLWMNLTDGGIFCGRKNFDGSGGNGHAQEHYRRTKHPLAVKLGTITPTSAGMELFSLTFAYERCAVLTFWPWFRSQFWLEHCNTVLTNFSSSQLLCVQYRKYFKWNRRFPIRKTLQLFDEIN